MKEGISFDEFHNGLRVLFSIDADEFIQAVHGGDGAPPVRDSEEWQDWERFRDNPPVWFIKAPDERAQAIYAIVHERNARHRRQAV